MITLALGIGANTAIFSMVNALLLHPYNFRDLDRLVRVWESRGIDDGFDARWMAAADADDLRKGTQVFEELSTYRCQDFNLTADGNVQTARGCGVSANFFDVLGVSPALGRTFTAAEEQPASGQVVIVSHGFWQRRFGGDPRLSEKIIQLDGRSYTVVGVMPPGFDYPVPMELWVPLALSPAERVDRSQLSLAALARLKPGVSVAQARAALVGVSRRLQQEYPQTNGDRSATLLQLRNELYLYTLPLFLLLQAAAGFVLLLASANLANLLFARVIGRQKEIAVRTALGADRRRLARLFVTETLLLSCVAGVAAIGVSFWSVKLLRTSISPEWTMWVPGWNGIQVDGTVLAFTIGLAACVGIVFGLATALHAGRVDPYDTLKKAGRGPLLGGRGKLRNALVVAQVTFALVLLVCAGLTAEGFLRLTSVYQGFQPANVLKLEIGLPEKSYAEKTSITGFYQRFLRESAALPGASVVALSSNSPASNVDNETTFFTIEGQPALKASEAPAADLQTSSPAYFRVLRIPLVAGRVYSDADDANAARVAVISRSMAARFWPKGDELGQRIKLGAADAADVWMTVVGVVDLLDERRLARHHRRGQEIELPHGRGELPAELPPRALRLDVVGGSDEGREAQAVAHIVAVVLRPGPEPGRMEGEGLAHHDEHAAGVPIGERGELHVAYFRPQGTEDRQGRLEGSLDRVVRRIAALVECAHEADAHPFERARKCRTVVGERLIGAARIQRVVPGHRLEEEGAVLDRPGKRTRVVEGVGERQDAAARDEAVGRLDPGDAAVVGRPADRAAGIRAGPGEHQAGRDRGPGTTRGAAGEALGVPGIARGRKGQVEGGPAPGELVGGELAEHHSTRRREFGDGDRVGLRHVIDQHLGVGRRRQALGLEDVLVPDRNAVKRPLGAPCRDRGGKLASYPVDGQIYGQPLYLPQISIAGGAHDVVYVTTQNDSVYAFDADAKGTQTTTLWHVTLGMPVTKNDYSGVSPVVGILSTPVIDSTTNTIYVFAESSSGPLFALHALDVATGKEKFGGPVEVTGTVSGTGLDSSGGKITLEPDCYQRMGLALNPVSNAVYIPFGSCNHGWVLVYDKTTLKQIAIFNDTPDGAGGGLWASGGAPAIDDTTGDLYLMSGVDAGDQNYTPLLYNDSFLRLDPNNLSILDFFAPSDNSYLAQHDSDLGSGANILMPDNGSSTPHEVIGGGKDGNIFIVNRDKMGGYNTSSNDVIQTVQMADSQFDNIFSTPVYWNGFVYYHPNGDVLHAFTWSNGLLSTKPAFSGNVAYQQHGATASLSANGAANGIIWDIDNSNYNNTGTGSGPAVLHAYEATNVANELYNSSQGGSRDTAGAALKFTVPTIASGRVFVGTSNELDIYGLLAP